MVYSKTLIIDTKKKTKLKRWLLVIVCLLKLLLIKKIAAIHH
jgi:hypothetical protein